MATSYSTANALTRTWWAGTNADLDIHLEAYEAGIDGTFRYDSIFRSMGLTNYKPISGTNTWRGDRIGGAVVNTRKSGGDVTPTRIVNDKMLLTVDTTAYVRTPIDYNDEWTSPDRIGEYGQEHGIAQAKFFDQAHIIQLIKAGQWQVPAGLTNFNPGITTTMTGYAAQADLSIKANHIVTAHRNAVGEMVKRDLGGSLSEFVTLVTPDAFNVLLNDNKLMNVDFNGGPGMGSGNYAQRRIAWLNGIRIIETARFPTGAIASHGLGPAFNVSATEAKALCILFNPRQTLLTIEAQPLVSRFWDDEKEMTHVLDNYTMYTVGVRRGDACAVISSD